jgi:TetR/AcrR family transcriptional repressor of nem operon
MAKDILEDTSIAPLNRIDRFLGSSIDHFQNTDYTGGCPIGNLAQEMGDLSPAFRNKLKEAMDMMVGAYTRVLADAQTAGEVSENLDVNETAYFIVAGWHGAIIQMKLSKNPSSLKTHRKFIFKHILKT